MKIKKMLVFVLTIVLTSQCMSNSLIADDMLAPMFKGETIESDSQTNSDSLTQSDETQTDGEREQEFLQTQNTEETQDTPQMEGDDGFLNIEGTEATITNEIIQQEYTAGIAPEIVSTSDTGISCKDGEYTIVNGDVSDDDENSAIVNCDNDSEVLIIGDVYGNGTSGVSADNESEVHVTRNVDVAGDGNDTVGVSVNNGSKVTVDGDVTSNDVCIAAENSSSVNVGGNVISNCGTGVEIDDSCKINVDGIISAAENAFKVTIDADKENNGVIKAATADAGSGSSIHFKIEDEQCLDHIEDYLPEIIIGELNSDYDKYISYEFKDNETGEITVVDSGEEIEKIYDEIQYIISVDYDTTKGSHLLEGKNVNAKNGTATESNDDEEVIVTIVPNDGYYVEDVSSSNDDKIKLKKIGDGVYSLIVPRGGGVKINAVISEIIKNDKPSQTQKPVSESNSEVIVDPPHHDNPGTTHISDAYNNKKVDVFYANTLSAFNNDNKWATYNESVVLNSLQNKITNAAINDDDVVIYLKDEEYFDKIDINNLQRINDKKRIVIYYWWHEIEYCVSIPVGYQLINLLSIENRCGRLDLASEFGARRTGRTR